jgi:lactoylglutathione lyase
VFQEVFPILYAADVERTVRFYCESFGFEITYRWPPEGTLDFAFLRMGQLGIGMGTSERRGEGAPRFELCFEVEDADAASARLLALGVKQLQPPTDQPWGERNAYFEDPDGNPIHVYAKERLDSAE